MSKVKKTRPIGVTILALFVLFTALWSSLRLGEAIFLWKSLAEYGAHPLYIAISGGVWLIAGLFLVWCLWQGKAWGWVAAFSGTVGYASWYWFDRLVLQRLHANWPFALVATAVFLFFILFILSSHSTRRFFQRDDHERKSENSTPA
jgi:predicted permease